MDSQPQEAVGSGVNVSEADGVLTRTAFEEVPDTGAEDTWACHSLLTSTIV